MLTRPPARMTQPARQSQPSARGTGSLWLIATTVKRAAQGKSTSSLCQLECARDLQCGRSFLQDACNAIADTSMPSFDERKLNSRASGLSK